LPSRRTFHTSKCRKASEKKGQDAATAAISGKDPLKGKPDHLKLTAAQRAALAAKRARENLKKQEEKASRGLKTGSLASNSIFGDEMLEPGGQTKSDEANTTLQEGLANRNFANMERVLNPRPNAKARWQRRMLIRHVRRGGRLTKEMVIARTERNHLSKSHFFKTSMKKLAPLTRQIAGKSVDQAILQMRFSKKKAAQDVLGHLIQARNEAIAIKGMGLDSSQPPPAPGPVVLDPSITPAGPNQKANKKNKDGSKSETEIYIDQAWINRGPYGQEPDYRARGRVFMLRPPHTGLSVLLKEEKTKLRIQEEKEAKAIRKRMGKNMWTQLPDRPVINQSQYVLW
jgi:ribosomal protein L22